MKAIIFLYIIPLAISLYYCFRYSVLHKKHTFVDYALSFTPILNILMIGLFYLNYVSLKSNKKDDDKI